MTESSFTDHLAHAQLLHDTVNNLTPPYAPGAAAAGDMDLAIDAYQDKITEVQVMHDAAEDASTAYGSKALDRAAHLTSVLTAVTSVLAYLRTKKPTLGTLLTCAEKIVTRMRGPKIKKTPAPLPGDPAPPVKERNRGQQSYMEQQGHLRTLINLLTGKPGYAPAPAGPGLPQHPASLDHLNGLLSGFRAFNSQISVLEADLLHAEALRQDAFENKRTGLHPLFITVKDAVQSQYGFSSTQYGTVAGIEW